MPDLSEAARTAASLPALHLRFGASAGRVQVIVSAKCCGAPVHGNSAPLDSEADPTS
jgi:hypothetical protein